MVRLKITWGEDSKKNPEDILRNSNFTAKSKLRSVDFPDEFGREF